MRLKKKIKMEKLLYLKVYLFVLTALIMIIMHGLSFSSIRMVKSCVFS